MSLRDDLRAAFYNVLLTAFPSTDIGLENQKFEQPKDTQFMEVWFKEISSKQASIGTTNKFKRHMGYFVVECFVPEKSGTKDLWDMCGDVSDAFEDQNYTLTDGSYVTTLTPEVFGNGKKNGFYSRVVMIKYILDAAPR